LKTKYFKILTIGLILIIICLFFILKLYNKPFIDIKNSKARIEVTVENILFEFQSNERLASEKYVDNLILIKGEIADISISNGNTIITLKDKNDISSVICQMLAEDNLNALKLEKGDEIIIKGICTGYLLDIMMVRCILTKDNF